MTEMAAQDEIVRDDANELLNASVSYGKRMLRKYGEFGPFGFRLNEDGQAVMEPIAQHQMPADAALLHDLLRQQLTERAQRGKLPGAALASNVTMAQPSSEGYCDAIMVEIEHRKGYVIKAFVPYKITGGQFFGFFPRVVRFGSIRTQPAVAQLFTF
ncbi:hypothetical protein [Silvibacterium dinghuense]|uniref:Uncharacterized protein n=1 Tax=Silvibacterium dinghuense TaxID=1560006 RepID=A0A4Q1SEH3_9BACT|nr:hypothetical protein [Silvibacterium dinghuense]RXS95679.1 hypothetical protein ESZ00_14100 [Silvibacterium dinghuense]GGH14886.1 hypothetical protein GCM10011586_35630 [Silvibacterium dinghuense]